MAGDAAKSLAVLGPSVVDAYPIAWFGSKLVTGHQSASRQRRIDATVEASSDWVCQGGARVRLGSGAGKRCKWLINNPLWLQGCG
jgi:hypothetical protein